MTSISPTPYKPLSSTFCCGRCHLFKPQRGRKARHILGHRGFICADCAKREPRK